MGRVSAVAMSRGGSILVVEAGVGDSDGHVAVRERIARHIFQHGARGAVFLVEDEGPKAVLLHAHDPLSSEESTKNAGVGDDDRRLLPRHVRNGILSVGTLYMQS